MTNRIEDAIYTALTANGTVSGLVSTRVYPEVAPQDGSRPFVVYQRISTARGYALDGKTLRSRPRFQLTCVGDTFDSARSVAHAVRSVLSGYKGSLGSKVTVNASFLDNETTYFDPQVYAWITQQDYMIWHQEAAS